MAVDLLHQELKKEDHWLEGIIFPGANLSGLSAPGARMPHANLQEAVLTDAVLPEALLSFADLTSASLCGATLARSVLDEAKLTAAVLRDVHLEYADLSGADLEGAVLSGAYLYGATLTRRTNFLGTTWDILGELSERKHLRAARVFREISSHFAEISDYRQASDFYYLEMDSLRFANSEAGGSYFSRLIWQLNLLIWGYGVRPARTMWWMLAVILVFGCVLYPVLGVQSGSCVSHSPTVGLALSLVTFATLGYGNRIPVGLVGELLGGIEALLGVILVSAFLVSLAAKYVHRR